jgi:hypothetical protein
MADETGKQLLVGKPTGKRLLRRPTCKWEDDEMSHIRMAQDRGQWHVLVNTVMKIRVSLRCGEFLE